MVQVLDFHELFLRGLKTWLLPDNFYGAGVIVTDWVVRRGQRIESGQKNGAVLTAGAYAAGGFDAGTVTTGELCVDA